MSMTGEMCCYDLSGPDQWKSGPDEVKKKCCNNPTGSPVIRPQYNMGQRQLILFGNSNLVLFILVDPFSISMKPLIVPTLIRCSFRIPEIKISIENTQN